MNNYEIIENLKGYTIHNTIVEYMDLTKILCGIYKTLKCIYG